MWQFLKDIAEAIWTGIKSIWNMCKKIIKAVINFFEDILDGLFDILEELLGNVPSSVEQSPLKPFLGDMDKLMENAPTRDVGLFKQKKQNLIKAVYDTRTGEILKPTYLGGDSIDGKTRETLGGEPLVILG